MRHAGYPIAALLVLLSCGWLEAQETGVVNFPDSITQLVVSPTSGVAAAMDAQKIVLYPKLSSAQSLANPIRVQMEGKPVAICHKPAKSGGIFIAADDRQSIYVLDDASGKLTGSVKLAVDVLDLAAPSTADSNIAFYVTRMGRRGSGTSVIGRLDVAAIKDLGQFSGADYTVDQFIIEAAADGRTIYLSRPGITPSGMYVLRQQAGDENRMAKAHEEHTSVAMYVPLPSGLGTAVNNQLRTVDLQSEMRELPGTAFCCMSSRPVIFCQSEDKASIIAASVNTGKALGSVRLAADQEPGGIAANRTRQRAEQVRLHKLKRWGNVDEVNQKLIVNTSRAAQVIPLAAFRLPDEPLMSVRIDGPSELVANEPWKAKIVNSSRDVQVSLGQAPTGMKLEGDTIYWTPNSSSVGAARVTLALSSKGVRSEQQLDLMVRQPWIKLPFAVGSYALTTDGSRLIMLRSEAQNGGGGGERRTSQLAAIELASGKVLFDKQLDFRASALDASNERVYMGAQQIDALYSLDIKNPDQVNKTFTDGMVQAMTVAGDRLYTYMGRRNNNGGLVVYALPKLEPIELKAPFPSWMLGQDFTRALPADIGGGWRHGEAVWAPDFSKVKLLLETPAMPTLMLRGSGGAELPDRVGRWGTVAQGGQIHRISGQVIAQGNDLSSGTLLVDLPAAAFLRVKASFENERQTNMTRAELVVVDLVEGREEKFPLMYERTDQLRLNSDEYRYGRRGMIFSQPGKVFAMLADRLFILPTKLLDASRFPEPLFFEAEQTPILVSGKGLAKVNYKLHGGRKPLRFSLLQDVPGLEVNATTGELTIDPQKLLSGQRLDYIIDQYAQRGTMEISAEQTRGPQALNLLQRASKQIEAVQYWTGVKPTGIPVAIRTGIRARDASQQEAVLEHAILIDMPAAALQSRSDERARMTRAQQEQQRQLFEKQQLEQQRLMEQRQLDQERRYNAGRNTATTQPADVAALSRRVQELELENAKLKAQLDLLKEIHQGGATSRPVR